MADRTGHLAGIIVALLIVAFAGAMLFDGRNLAANPFEPLGSRTIPSWAAWITIALAVLVMAEAAYGLARSNAAASAGEQWVAVVLAMLLTVAYVGVLASGRVRYGLATTIFIPLVVLAVADNWRRALPWSAGLGVVYGVGLDYIFRHVLVTDIP